MSPQSRAQTDQTSSSTPSGPGPSCCSNLSLSLSLMVAFLCSAAACHFSCIHDPDLDRTDSSPSLLPDAFHRGPGHLDMVDPLTAARCQCRRGTTAKEPWIPPTGSLSVWKVAGWREHSPASNPWNPRDGKDETSNAGVQRAFQARRLAASSSLIGRNRSGGPPDSDTCTLRGEMGRWMARKWVVWGRRGDGIWATDLSSSRRSTWPCAKLLFSWPVGAHGAHPTHIKHPKARNAAAVRSSTGPATRDGSSGLSRSRPVQLKGEAGRSLISPSFFFTSSTLPGIAFCSVHPPHMPSS